MNFQRFPLELFGGGGVPVPVSRRNRRTVTKTDPTMKWDQYLRENEFAPVVLFRQLFPEFTVESNYVQLRIPPAEYDSILSQHFPIDAWTLFTRDDYGNVALYLKDVDQVLRYLSDETFVPQELNFAPSDMGELLAKFNDLSNGQVEIVDGEINIGIYMPLEVSQYAPPYLMARYHQHGVQFPLAQLKSMFDWIFEIFPLHPEPELKLFRLYVYLKRYGVLTDDDRT